MKYFTLCPASPLSGFNPFGLGEASGKIETVLVNVSFSVVSSVLISID